ncbi:MAG: GC-type dockerin domain-anchored protein [bacterium]
MSVLRLCVLCLLAVLGVSSARAQCTPVWQPFDPSTASFPGVSGTVHATTMWDPDGLGPQTPMLVVGGDFTVAGKAVANYIAAYDPATGQWSALGSGMGGAFPSVRALAVLPNGDLVAGGQFNTAGGVSANNIARWNGSAWSPLGSGMDSSVLALAVLPNGDLVAGGSFITAGGVTAGFIARWNGSAWSPLGSGFNGSSPVVRALAVLPNGNLVAGGLFATAGGQSAGNIARWNGSAWSPLESGVNGSVFALAVLPSGDLVAGGQFTTAGGQGASDIARWNGSAWSPLGSGLSNGPFPRVSALAVLPNGDVVAGGFFTTAGGRSANRIARWNGSAWSPLGSGMNNAVNALAMLPNGDLVAGGDFLTAGGVVAPYLARWGCPPPTACNPADITGIGGPPSAPDGLLTGDDFNAFIAAFAQGCP